MTVTELRRKHVEAFGEPTRSGWQVRKGAVQIDPLTIDQNPRP